MSEEDGGESNDNSYDVVLNIAKEHCSNDKDVQNDLDKRELLEFSCFIHTLQPVVKDSLNESICIRSTMARVAAIARLTHQSITVAEKLQDNKFSILQLVITR